MTQIGIRRKFNPFFRITSYITGFFISLFLFFICLPTLILFKLWASTSFLLKRLQYGRTVSRLHKLDKTHCVKIDKSYSYINCPLRYKGTLDLEYIKDKWRTSTYECTDKGQRKRLRRTIQFQDISIGYCYFRDDVNFDIDNHIKEVSRSELFGEEEEEDVEMCWEDVVHKMLDKYGTREVDAGPQWEFVLYRESEERYSGLFRFHHKIADGINYIRFFLETLADDDTAVGQFPYKYKRQNIFVRSFTALVNICAMPFAVFDMAMICETMKDNQLHGPELSGKKHFVLSKPIPLAMVKEIKDKVKTALNVTFFSAYSHALNEFFKLKNEKVKDCWMLFPLLRHNRDEPVSLCNSYKYSFINLPLGRPHKFPKSETTDSLVTITDPSLERLYDMKKYLSYYQRDVYIQANAFLLEAANGLLPPFLQKYVISNKGFMSMYSSMAACKDEVPMFNSRLEELAFLGFDQNPNGLFFSILGYKDILRAGITVDTGLIPCRKQAQKNS